MNKKILNQLTYIGLFLLSANVAIAYVASSSNYRIQSDSINVGGNLSTSTNYSAQDTIGEVGVGTSSSATYQVKAGYQQMQQTYLAITSVSNVPLAPNILSIGGGTATGQASWTVVTDDPLGYTLAITSASTPSLRSGANSFADYTPAGAAPDYSFSIASNTSEFAYSPEGTDVASYFRDNGVSCNVGASDNVNHCWAPLLTSSRIVASRASANNPAGSTLTIKFQAESGLAHVQPVGAYVATATLTVMAL